MITINLGPHVSITGERWRLPAIPPRRLAVMAAVALSVVTFGVTAWRHAQERALAQLTADWNQLRGPREELEATRATVALLERQETRLTQLRTSGIRWAPRLNLLSDAMVSGVWFTRLIVEPPDVKARPTAGAAKASRAASASAPKASSKSSSEAASRSKTKGSARKGPAAPRLVVTGIALVPTGEQASPLGAMLESVKRQPQFSQYFEQVEVQSAGRGKIGRQDVTEFTLVFEVKEASG